MRKIILLSLTFLCYIAVIGQNRKAIELSLVSRYDRHANFVTNFGGRAYNDTMKLFGISSGVNIQLRKPLSPSYSLYLGMGYYRLGVNKIRNTLPFGIPGVGTGRSIRNEDDDSTKIGYGTSKYHYNNLALTIGLSKLFLLQNGFTLDIGAEAVGYSTFSQVYMLNTYRYQTANPKPLEVGVNTTVGLLKEYDKFYIRPALLIPIYQNLKGDKAFDENRSMNIPKWFNGIGLTLRIGKYI